MANVKFDKLVASIEKAKAAYETAKLELEQGLDSVPLGTVFAIGGVPYNVTAKGDKKTITCMLSKRAQAAMRGEEVPEYKPRKRRTKEEMAASNGQA